MPPGARLAPFAGMLVSTVVALVGLFMWLVASHPKMSEAGRILFAVGVLVTVFALAGKDLHMPIRL